MSYTKALNYYLENDCYKDDFSAYDRSQLIKGFDFVELKTDDVLYTSKFSSQFLYFVIQGSLTLHTSTGQQVVIDRGQYVGEEAALGLPFYSNKVIANKNCSLIKIPGVDFHNLLISYNKMPAMVKSYTEKLMAVSFPTSSTLVSPVSLHAEPAKKWFVEEIIWALSLIISLFVYCIYPSSFSNQNAYLFLTMASCLVFIWSFSILPSYIVTLILFTGCIWLKIVPPEIIFSGFSNPTFLTIFSILALSIVVIKSHLFDRIIMLILKFMPSTSFWTNTSIFVLGISLTPLTSVLSHPHSYLSQLVKNYYQQLGFSSHSKSAQKIIIAAYAGATLFTSNFLTSSIYNIIFFNILEKDTSQFQWSAWFIQAFPLGFFLLIFFATGFALFFHSAEKPFLIRERPEVQLKILGKINSKDKSLVFLIFSYFLILSTENYHNISWIYSSIFLFIILIVFHFLSFKTAKYSINWSIVLFGAMITGLLKTVDYLQLNYLLLPYLNFLIPLLKLNFIYFALGLGFILSFIRIFLPYDLTLILGYIFLIPFAQEQGLNLWVVGFLILFFSQESLIPTASSPLHQFFKASCDELDPLSNAFLWKYHFMIFLVKSAAVICAASFWKDMNLI